MGVGVEEDAVGKLDADEEEAVAGVDEEQAVAGKVDVDAAAVESDTDNDGEVAEDEAAGSTF